MTVVCILNIFFMLISHMRFKCRPNMHYQFHNNLFMRWIFCMLCISYNFISFQFKFDDSDHFLQLHQIDLICLSGLSSWEETIFMKLLCNWFKILKLVEWHAKFDERKSIGEHQSGFNPNLANFAVCFSPT